MTADPMTACTWPILAEPYAAALRRAVGLVFHELEPAGIIAAGSVIRGKAHASSDLDVYVVHLGATRRRIQRLFDSVPAEIFINPPSAVRGYFADEDRDGRPLTAHMLATGVVVFRADPVVDELRVEAAEWLRQETKPSDGELVSSRYSVASRLEDALDVLDSDATTATMLLGDAVLAMLEYHCKATRGRIPRRKDLVAQLATEQPDIAVRTVAFFRTSELAERARLATEIADRTIGARGFFEWDSGWGPAG